MLRICTSLRQSSPSEPCIEQYERHVAMLMDEEVTPAASAWISLIVESLRLEIPFLAEDYVR